jgi:hypothetical protein
MSKLICEVVSRIQMDILTGRYKHIDEPSNLKLLFVITVF